MVFSSVTFLFYFLPLFLIVYFSLRSLRQRNIALVLFSLLFYGWGEPRYLPLILISIFLNWYLAKQISNCSKPHSRKLWLILALIVNLGGLCFFKYTPWIVDSLQHLSVSIPYGDFLRRIPLPVGISFYTFQAMSYVIDVYRQRFPYEKSLLDLGTYIVMFPQLVAGPIVRYEQVKKELHSREILLSIETVKGFLLVIIGLSSKVILADTFSLGADYAFSLDPTRLSMGLAWLGALSYFFQIYFDFSGYSLIAIGLGRIIGFTFPENFDRPYIATSITEFWRRWHMTLSTWFRDYLYIPLGGNRSGPLITCRNLLIVFILCGIWHGAGGHFLFWGLYHGLFLVLERLFRGRAYTVPVLLSHGYTMLVVLLGWVIFKSTSISQTASFLGAMLGLNGDIAYLPEKILSPLYTLFLVLGFVLSLYKINLDYPPFFRYQNISWMVYPLLLAICIGYLVVGTHSPFIYFKF